VKGFNGEEYLKRREWHFEAMLPGHPKPDQYRVEQTNQFRIHNRCVDKMKVGRVLLAADSAHICNPFGGYGLMMGVLDVGALAECFIGIYQGRAGEEILDKYAEIRREKFMKYVNPRSIKNMERLRNLDPEKALEKDKFLQLLADLEKKPKDTREFLLVGFHFSIRQSCKYPRTNKRLQKVSNIEHDFTQYYTS
jgi:2-polyprenyl-6-methoxyphenol hydroxylase-like FAD-dependent oxidoreductase